MKIEMIKDVVAQIAPLYPVISIDLFGSFARGENKADSDIDLLVSFDENIASVFDMSGLKFDIQGKLNKKIDIVAGPLKEDSYLTIDKRIRIYEV